ncbi:glycosyl hydrolase family 18 protein [Tunturiibacter empetritectus]|uniref:glycosyl hydrolase family 18 protein n=1 Tax=Tunturiibacter empetritectus TaxID=3069691 RepID=UPI003D9B85A6
MTRINYAFADLQNGKIVEGFAHDAENFAALNALKHANPSLTVLVSIGGWTWSGNFSDMSLTRQRRKIFIESAVQFIEKYELDGLDIDWEYPGMSGDNHRFRPEDKQNYTLLLKELRTRFNHEEENFIVTS